MKRLMLCLVVILAITNLSVSAQDIGQDPRGLKVGDPAPAFMGKDNQGNDFDLQAALKKGPVVLVFYRGQWCPYCNKQLSRLNDSLQFLKNKGASVVAVSPEIQENVAKTVAKTKVSFPVLSDNGLTIMRSYQVNFAVDEDTQAKYRKYGIEFDKANGSNGANLPVPATYIIGQDGKIRYAFFNPDYSKRSSVKDLLDNL